MELSVGEVWRGGWGRVDENRSEREEGGGAGRVGEDFFDLRIRRGTGLGEEGRFS
jgi:hypothetical protein